MGFITRGWVIKDGIIQPPADIDKWKAYKFIQEAIYDSHIPVTRVIGYYLTSGNVLKQSAGLGVLRRDQTCAEDRFTIAANLAKLMIPVYDLKYLYTKEVAGVLTVDSMGLHASSGDLVESLTTKPYILRSLGPVSLDMVVSTNTGYVSADENFNVIMNTRKVRSKSRYFPIYSYHNILNFVKVLPFTGDVIRLRYSNGMNDRILLAMLEKMWISGDPEFMQEYKEVWYEPET